MVIILRYSKDRFIQMLLEAGDFEEAKEKMALEEYDPLFKKRLIHPEESPIIKDYNTMLLEAKNDINVLHYQTMSTSVSLKRLADNIAFRLNNIQEKLEQEKEIRDDMKMLCNAYQEFDSLIIIDNYIAAQTCDYQKGVFKSKAIKTEDITYKVKEVIGNGSDGNTYVLNKDNKFLSQIAPTDNTKAFTDNDLQTYYEYQRITVDEKETFYAQYMHKDNIPARCDIILEASQVVNECQISGNVFTLNGLYFSNDGIHYNNALSTPVLLNNSNSIPSTGYNAFPSGQFIKLSCESVGSTADVIGFEIIKKDEELIQSKARLGIEDSKPSDSAFDYDNGIIIRPLDSAKRKVIKLNEVKLMRSVYSNNSYFTTNNLLQYPVQSVALYADVYIPPHFKEDDYVTFELSINNRVFNIVPINSALNGVKIIKTSTLELNAHYGEYVDEPITDARLTVRFKCPNENESALIKHVRLLVGEQYEN